MADDGELQTQEIERTAGLRVRFNAFSSLALYRWGGKIDLDYPFFYLKSQGFWVSIDPEGRSATSVGATQRIQLNPEWFELMNDAGFRRDARVVLVETYFPPEERLALYTLLGVEAQCPEFQKERKMVQEEVASYAVTKGRSARFTVQVVCGYHHTCALTGHRIITTDGESLVEAAHIEPWAETQNDDPHNGLALSRNAHWAFDRGLWLVDDDSRIVVRPAAFSEWGPDPIRLHVYHGQELQFAPQTHLRPNAVYLWRHRQRWACA